MTTVGTFPVFLEWRMSSARQSARDVASRSSNSIPSARISSRASAQYGQLGLTYMIRDAMPGTLGARDLQVQPAAAGLPVAVPASLSRSACDEPSSPPLRSSPSPLGDAP